MTRILGLCVVFLLSPATLAFGQDVSSIPDGTVRRKVDPDADTGKPDKVEPSKDENTELDPNVVTGNPDAVPDVATDPDVDPIGDAEVGPASDPDANEKIPTGTVAEGDVLANQLHLAVVDSATYGIDPIVGKHVDHRLRMVAKEAGYKVVPRNVTVEAALTNKIAYPPSPADLWRTTFASGAQRGVFARIWANEGKYVYEITVASLDGTGPYFARGTSAAEDLHATVTALLEEALPAASVWNAAKAEELARGPVTKEPEPDETFLTAPVYARIKRIDNRPTRRWAVAFQTESAFGLSSDFFYNHLFGVRLDFRITNDTSIGWYLGYANLRGRNGRLSSVLPYMQVEHKIRIKPGSDISIPLRGGIGYLPFNGPFFRLAVGVNIPISERIEVAFDIISPTFWVLPEKVAVSLNLAAEVIIRFGKSRAEKEKATP